LKHATKTETELRTDWRKDAERRSISQLALYEIAKQEKITPSEEEIDAELIRLKTMMPEADEDRAREYLHQALTNEKVLAFLEKCN
jgi:FKBP-type peptidyl-prolyl cis-trans isomerase (trigger factor)